MIGDRIYDSAQALSPISAHPHAPVTARAIVAPLRASYYLAQRKCRTLTSRSWGKSLLAPNPVIVLPALVATEAGSGWCLIPAGATHLVGEVEFEYYFSEAAVIEHRIRVTQGVNIDTGDYVSFDPASAPPEPPADRPGVAIWNSLPTSKARQRFSAKLSNVTPGDGNLCLIELQALSTVNALRYLSSESRWEVRND